MSNANTPVISGKPSIGELFRREAARSGQGTRNSPAALESVLAGISAEVTAEAIDRMARAKVPAAPVAGYKFAVGDRVSLLPNASNSNVRPGVYTIVGRLPASSQGCQYRAKNALDKHERVLDEAQIRRA